MQEIKRKDISLIMSDKLTRMTVNQVFNFFDIEVKNIRRMDCAVMHTYSTIVFNEEDLRDDIMKVLKNNSIRVLEYIEKSELDSEKKEKLKENVKKVCDIVLAELQKFKKEIHKTPEEKFLEDIKRL